MRRAAKSLLRGATDRAARRRQWLMDASLLPDEEIIEMQEEVQDHVRNRLDEETDE